MYMKKYLTLGVVVFMFFSSTALAKNDNDPLGKVWNEIKAIKSRLADIGSPHLYDSAGVDLGRFISLDNEPSLGGASYLVYNKNLDLYINYFTADGVIGQRTNNVRFENSDCTGLALTYTAETVPSLLYRTINGYYKVAEGKTLEIPKSESDGGGGCYEIEVGYESNWITIEKVDSSEIYQPQLPYFIKN